MAHKRTLDDFCILPLDQEFIDGIEQAFEISPYDVDLDLFIQSEGEMQLTNAIIYEMMLEIAGTVKNKKDQEKLIDSIYVNFLDSSYNVEASELKSKQAKKILDKFNSL